MRLELMKRPRKVFHIGIIRLQEKKSELRAGFIPDSWEKRYDIDQSFQSFWHISRVKKEKNLDLQRHYEMSVAVFFFFTRDTMQDDRRQRRAKLDRDMIFTHNSECLEHIIRIELNNFFLSLDGCRDHDHTISELCVA